MSPISFEEALSRLLAAARPVTETETVPIERAAGRVLASGVVSPISVPPLDNSAMDGYALRCADLTAPGTTLPVSQRIPAGSIGHTLQPGTAARIFTGAPIPPGADAVVMQELCEHAGATVTVNHAPRSGENIRRAGEDVAAGTEVLSAGTRLTPQTIGLLASVGVAQVPVFRQLRVALFSTGDELVTPGQPLPPGAIYNSNRYLLASLLEQAGCQVTDLGIVADTLDATRAALRAAAQEHDLILTSGGVSVGEEDHVKPAVSAEGELALWAIAIKPGKPLAYGHVRRQHGDPADFIGLPGNPVAAFVTFLTLVQPFIRRRQGGQGAPGGLPAPLMLPAGFDWNKADVRRNFLRVRLSPEGRVELFPNQGSGVLTSTVWSDGLVSLPAGQTVAVGQPVPYLPFSRLLD